MTNIIKIADAAKSMKRHLRGRGIRDLLGHLAEAAPFKPPQIVALQLSTRPVTPRAAETDSLARVNTVGLGFTLEHQAEEPEKQKRSQPSLYWRKEAEHDGQHLTMSHRLFMSICPACKDSSINPVSTESSHKRLIEVLLWQCWVIQKPPCRCYQRG